MRPSAASCSAAAARTPRSGCSRCFRNSSGASLAPARRRASSTAGRTRGSGSESMACSTPRLISSFCRPSAVASAWRTRKSGSASRPERTSAKSSGLVRASAPNAGPRTQGLRSATSATRRGLSSGSAGICASASSASRRTVSLPEAIIEAAAAVPRLSPIAPSARNACTATPSSRSRTSGSSSSTASAALSAPRPRAARARERGSSEASAATSTGRRAGSSRRIASQVAAHQSKRGLPLESSASCAAGLSPSAASAKRPSRCSAQPSAVPPGSSPRTAIRLIVGGSVLTISFAIGSGSARVSDSAERLRGFAPKAGVGVAEQRQQPVDRAAVGDQAEREGRHPANLGLGVGEQVAQRRRGLRASNAAGRQRGAAADRPIGIAQQLQQGRSRAACVLELGEADQPLAARGRLRWLLLRSEQVGARQGCQGQHERASRGRGRR